MVQNCEASVLQDKLINTTQTQEQYHKKISQLNLQTVLPPKNHRWNKTTSILTKM